MRVCCAAHLIGLQVGTPLAAGRAAAAAGAAEHGSLRAGRLELSMAMGDFFRGLSMIAIFDKVSAQCVFHALGHHVIYPPKALRLELSH